MSEEASGKGDLAPEEKADSETEALKADAASEAVTEAKADAASDAVVKGEKKTDIKRELLPGDDHETKKTRLTVGAKVAIVVPFRDLDPRQKRKEHLERFVPYMADFLAKLDDIEDFKIFIIEQSDDGRKFNRGKLLNIGFILGKREGFDTFVFHDVDLLPREVVGKWYAKKPSKKGPIHIARCWSRYNKNQKYLGGIVSFSAEDFQLIDGFPNIYWGWGGEDDELSKRVTAAGYRVDGPDRQLHDAIIDMEEMTLSEKLDWLRANKEVKCGVKWEVNDEHDAKRKLARKPKWWGVSGLENKVTELKRQDDRLHRCSIVTVDVGLNYEDDGSAHWTNNVNT